LKTEGGSVKMPCSPAARCPRGACGRRRASPRPRGCTTMAVSS